MQTFLFAFTETDVQKRISPPPCGAAGRLPSQLRCTFEKERKKTTEIFAPFFFDADGCLCDIYVYIGCLLRTMSATESKLLSPAAADEKIVSPPTSLEKTVRRSPSLRARDPDRRRRTCSPTPRPRSSGRGRRAGRGGRSAGRRRPHPVRRRAHGAQAEGTPTLCFLAPARRTHLPMNISTRTAGRVGGEGRAEGGRAAHGRRQARRRARPDRGRGEGRRDEGRVAGFRGRRQGRGRGGA